MSLGLGHVLYKKRGRYPHAIASAGYLAKKGVSYLPSLMRYRANRLVPKSVAYKRPYSKKSSASVVSTAGSSVAFRRKKKFSSRKRYVPKDSVRSLSKKIKTISKEVKAGMGKLIYRQVEAATLQVANNVQAFASYSLNRIADIEGVLAQLRYYDVTNPGTLLTVSGATGSFQRRYNFCRTFSRLIMRNNYMTVAKVKCYALSVKDDTSIAPDTAYTNGMADNASDTAGTSVISYLTDSVQFNELYKINKRYEFVISPGDEVKVEMSCRQYMYDPSLSDTHSTTYQTQYNSSAWIVFIQGVVAHDTTVTTEHGIQQCGVDILHYKVFEVKYDAGADIEFVYTTVTLDTPANGFVQGARPIPDNIAYSVA